MNLKRSVFFLLAAAGLPLGAQTPPTFDTSGNAMLNGTYYFREVITLVSDTAGDVSRNLALYGTVSFSGNGSYTITNGTALDSQTNSLETITGESGTYSIMGSGYGFMSSPISSGDSVYGLVSHGVFVGSSTESGFNDLFIAAQIPSPLPSNSTFQGSWTLDGYFLPPAGSSVGDASDATFQIAPDASGNVGNVNITGYFGGIGGGTTVYPQASSGVKYSISSGAAVLTFPTSTTAPYYSGGSQAPEYLYFSPDGNFVFGGSPVNFDMIVGVRNGVGAPNFGGLYYQAGINHDFSSYASAGFANLITFYGSFNTAGSAIVAADRVQDVFNPATYNATYQDSFTPNAASYTDSATSMQYVAGDNGTVRIGFGVGPFLGLTVAVQASALNASGVYINPAGIFNAGTFAPFTAGMAPGEIIVIYGSTMAPSGLVSASKTPLPTILNGVQVLVDGVAAPIYYVSPGQLAIQVPYTNPFTVDTFESIQVSNNGALSNSVTEYLDDSIPGVFGGITAAAVFHSNGSLVTAANPAQPGETYVQAYLTGLGAVTPAVADGAAASSNPLAYSNDYLQNQPGTACVFCMYVGNAQVTSIEFAGLSPTYASLGQVNFDIPANATAGNQGLQIFGPDSGPDKTPVVPDYQRPPITVISVGSGIASPLSISAPPRVSVKPRALGKRKAVCLLGKCSAN